MTRSIRRGRRWVTSGLTALLVASWAQLAEGQYLKASVASFSSSAAELAPDDVPGSTLVFTPTSASEIWIVLISARLSGTTTGFKSAEARYLINGGFAGIGNVKNSASGSPGPWQHFARITGTTAQQVVQVQLSAPDGGTATIEDLQVIAFRLPENADFQYAETAGQQGVAAGAWNDYRSLTFTPSSTGDYLVMAVANFNEPFASSTVAVRLRDSGGTFWPVDSDGTRDGFLANGSANWQTFFLARVQNLDSASSHTFTIQGNGAPGGSVLRDQRIMAFRTDVFDNAQSVETLSESSTSSTTPQVKATLNTTAPASRQDHIIIQSEVLRNSSGTWARRAGFEADDVVQTDYSHIINDTNLTSYGFFDAVSAANTIKYENTFSSSSIFFTVAAKESVIHVLRLSTCTPTINYRSIGTAAGILYNTGTATVDAGAVTPATITFGGGASLPTNVGRGDRLILDPAGTPQEFFILTRDSATQATVQSPATFDQTDVAYEIRRAYNTIQAWETDREGDLVAENRRETGVAYNDGDFTTGATIDGSTTDACSFMTLTVAPGHRHQGIAGIGVALDGLDTDQGLRVQDDYTVVEWLELERIRGGVGAASVVVQQASNVLLQNLLVHDFDDGVESVHGIRGESNAGYTVRNSIFYDGDTAAIRNNDSTATGVVQNCTVYGNPQWGVLHSAGSLTVTNTLSLGNPSGDFGGTITQSYNISSDATASGTGSLTGRTATDNPTPGAGNWVVFQNLAVGGENLHLQTSVENDAIDAGDDLSASFSRDIDGELRPGGAWDVGADELGESLMITGTYSGDGVAGRQITGLGFQPDVVILKVDDGAAGSDGVIRTATMSGTKELWSLAAPAAGLITSLDADGFTVGNDVKVNSNTACGGVCTYYWTAFKAGTDLTVGTYTGNGTLATDTQAIAGLGYSPDYVILISDASNRWARNRTRFGGNNSKRLRNAGRNSDTIPSLDADGFTVQVGIDTQEEMNTSGMLYHFVAFNEVAGKTKVGTYLADGNDDTNITGVGFQPDYLLVQAYDSDYQANQKSDKMVGDASTDFMTGLLANRIQALQPDGFQIGSDTRVNDAGVNYAYVAFKGTAVPTAVTLASFTATGLDGSVLLEWETASELDNLGFHLYRGPSEDGPFERITDSVIPGLGSSPAGAKYSYRDTGLTNGVTYHYELEDIETTGDTKRHGPVSTTPAPGARGGEPDESPDSSSPSRITYGDPSASSLTVSKRGPRQLVLELVTEGFYAEPQEDGSVRLVVPGLESSGEVTGPDLPVKRTWVDAIAGQKVRIASIQARDVETFTSLRPSNAVAPEIVATREGTVRLHRRRRQAFGRGDPSPSSGARIVSVGFQGEDKKALVELAPFRWDGATGQLVLARRLVVRLSFRGREPSELATKGGRGRRYARRRSHEERDVVARLHTTRPGLYGVRYEDVMRSRRGVQVKTLRLSRQGEAVAFRIEPGGNRFEPGSVLYFVSEGAAANPHGREAVYELERGASGAVMAEVSAAPSGEPQPVYWHHAEWEENRYYQPGLVDAPDLWLWDALFAPGVKSYPLRVSALAPSAAEASKLSVWLQGVSDFTTTIDHHVRIYVNGTLMEELSWDGKGARRADIELAPGMLREGGNVLELENVGDTEAAYSMVMLDRYAVEYPRAAVAIDGRLRGRWSASGTAELSGLVAGAHVLDVSDGQPNWVDGAELGADGLLRFRAEAGGRYLAVGPDAIGRPEVTRPRTSRLKSSGNRADYVVIGPEIFLEAAAPLLQLRQSEGLKVEAVSIEAIYSEFGFGERTPRAVQDFLSYAYHHWRKPSPRYVVLLGDATYDFEDRLGTGVTNHVPPLIVKTSYLWTASDPSYAAVNGEDVLPDLALGRLPAGSVAEVRAMVEKIVAYERGDAGVNGAPVVLVADDPDRAGNFEGDADALARGLLRHRTVRKIYSSELGTSATRHEIVEAYDEGASILSYIGHGGIHLWADENIFNAGDVASLQPQAQQPLVLTMNCLNGYFHFPYFSSLAEELVKAEGRGAIAAFSPSGLSLNEAANVYHQKLLEEVVRSDHARLGDAVLAAQEAYADAGSLPELLSIYHLFGDPALRLR